MKGGFEFATAGRIVFGAGKIDQLGGIAREFGTRALFVTGGNASRAARATESLRASGIECLPWSVESEPTTTAASDSARQAREFHADMVVGFGGGSAIDLAKAAAALAGNDGDILDFVEIIGRAHPLPRAGLPCIAIPTTAGAGAEATRNAVLLSPEHRLKVSLRSPHLLPRVALVDPELTYSLPPEQTAATGLDALTQLIEPFVSIRSTPMTDALCREGIGRAARSLQRAYENGRDAAAREDMALASLLGGIALANAGLGAVHGFASPIGGMFRAPHGAVCAALLPHATRVNIAALRSREPNSPALSRYAEVAELLTGQPGATPETAADWLAHLVDSLRIPPLRTYGISPSESAAIIQAAAGASSMKGNPISLTPIELSSILAASI